MNMSTDPETAPEPWEAIVSAAIRWRNGMDRGELAQAVDAFTGDGPLDVMAARFAGAMRANPEMANAIFTKMVADLKGLAARESDPLLHTLQNAPMVKGALNAQDAEGAAEFAQMKRVPVGALRTEQYADGAGAQAWRQAMGGKL